MADEKKSTGILGWLYSFVETKMPAACKANNNVKLGRHYSRLASYFEVKSVDDTLTANSWRGGSAYHSGGSVYVATEDSMGINVNYAGGSREQNVIVLKGRSNTLQDRVREFTGKNYATTITGPSLEFQLDKATGDIKEVVWRVGDISPAVPLKDEATKTKAVEMLKKAIEQVKGHPNLDNVLACANAEADEKSSGSSVFYRPLSSAIAVVEKATSR